jgi:hypothetical protein
MLGDNEGLKDGDNDVLKDTDGEMEGEREAL